MNCFYCKNELIHSDSQDIEIDGESKIITYLYCQKCLTSYEVYRNTTLTY